MLNDLWIEDHTLGCPGRLNKWSCEPAVGSADCPMYGSDAQGSTGDYCYCV